MLVFDFDKIGNKLYTMRKQMGMTQSEVAESAGLSDRTYADIERGTVNMRMETFLRICSALKVMPNEILTEESFDCDLDMGEIMNELAKCSAKERHTALMLLQVYLQSLR